MYQDQVLSQMLHTERRKVAAQVEMFLMDRTNLKALFPRAHCMVMTSFACRKEGYGFEVVFFDGLNEKVTTVFDSFSNPLRIKQDEPKAPGDDTLFELRIQHASMRLLSVEDLLWLQQAAYNLEAFSSAAYAATVGINEWKPRGAEG